MPFASIYSTTLNDYPRNYFTREDQEKISQIAKDIITSLISEKESFAENIDKKNGRYYYNRSPMGNFLGLGSLYASTMCKFMNVPVGGYECGRQCKDFLGLNDDDEYVVCNKCFERKKEFEI